MLAKLFNLIVVELFNGEPKSQGDFSLLLLYSKSCRTIANKFLCVLWMFDSTQNIYTQSVANRKYACNG